MPSRSLGAAIAAALVVALAATPSLAAQSGGSRLPAAGASDPATKLGSGSGGVRYRQPDRARPVLTRLEVSRRNLFAFGRPVRIAFAIRDNSHYVRARLHFIRQGDGRTVFRAHIGRIRTGRTHLFSWKGTEGGNVLEEGAYRVRVVAHDRAGNRLRRSQVSTGAGRISFLTHRFPVAGPYSFGGSDLRFGAKRRGHTHQGQDISAAQGTPVVTPRGGAVSARGFDAAGAGNYLVIDAAGEDFDYVFMHLQHGSLLVRRGDRVATGQRIANVGSTGYSTGPHLHFEIWRGAWFAGGRAIDPLPALRVWDRSS